MGLLAQFYHLWDTICYIHKNGWAEYCEARKRYDNHIRLQGYSEGKFNKKNYIKNINALKKRK
jgi:hypothetical protein